MRLIITRYFNDSNNTAKWDEMREQMRQWIVRRGRAREKFLKKKETNENFSLSISPGKLYCVSIISRSFDRAQKKTTTNSTTIICVCKNLRYDIIMYHKL